MRERWWSPCFSLNPRLNTPQSSPRRCLSRCLILQTKPLKSSFLKFYHFKLSACKVPKWINTFSHHVLPRSSCFSAYVIKSPRCVIHQRCPAGQISLSARSLREGKPQSCLHQEGRAVPVKVFLVACMVRASDCSGSRCSFSQVVVEASLKESPCNDLHLQTVQTWLTH